MGTTDTTSNGISRRTIAKGAAWAAPAITLGVAAPSLAASPPPVGPSVGDDSCKHTKSINRYHIELIFTNNLACKTNVVITSFVVNPNSGQDVPFDGIDYDFEINAKDSMSWVYDSQVVGNMANGTVDVVYTYTNCRGEKVDETQSINVSSLPPCEFPYPHDANNQPTGAPEGATKVTAETEASEEPTADATTPTAEPAAEAPVAPSEAEAPTTAP